jgi:hypothetical protein
MATGPAGMLPLRLPVLRYRGDVLLDTGETTLLTATVLQVLSASSVAEQSNEVQRHC